MAKEILDTSSNKLSGRCRFMVVGVPEKKHFEKFTKRIWKLQPLDKENAKPIEYHVVPWEAEGIVMVTGGQKTLDGKTEWDDQTVSDKCFSAEVSYVERDPSNPKNINSKTGKPYFNMVLSNFEETTPF